MMSITTNFTEFLVKVVPFVSIDKHTVALSDLFEITIVYTLKKIIIIRLMLYKMYSNA